MEEENWEGKLSPQKNNFGLINPIRVHEIQKENTCAQKMDLPLAAILGAAPVPSTGVNGAIEINVFLPSIAASSV